MSEMVERVARAMFAVDDCGAWSDDPGPHNGDCTNECHTCRRCLQNEYIAKARLAIATIAITPKHVLKARAVINGEPTASDAPRPE